MALAIILIENTDPGVRSMYANLEKESNGERFRTTLINALDQVEKNHSHNVGLQHDIDDTWEVDFDPMPDPGDRVLVPVPEFDWGNFSQIDQDGNITMP